MCIIDVLQSSHMRVPARLSAETIVNLAENKVPYPVFEKLFREGLKAQVAPLTQWDGRDAMFDLWCYLARIGGVIPARRAREASAEAKAKGYRIREPEEPDDEDDFADSNLTHERSTGMYPFTFRFLNLSPTVSLSSVVGRRNQWLPIISRRDLHGIARFWVHAYELRSAPRQAVSYR